MIFDLDGVIVDSEIWWDEVRAAFAAAHGRAWTADDQAAVMGANSAAWARIMRERLDLDLPDAAIERAIVDGVVERYRREGAPRIDGTIEAIRRIAADLPVAVASSSHAEVIDAALDATGLGDVFTVAVSSDEVADGKPAPDVYLEAARRLGIAPANCLVVEDSLNGVRAGKAAGMFVVLVPNASVPPAPGTSELADLVLDRLADLDPARIDPRRPGSSAGGRGLTGHAHARSSAPARTGRQPLAADDPLLGLAGRDRGDRPGVPPGPARGSRAAPTGPGHLLLQPPELVRSVRVDGRPAVSPAPVVLRSRRRRTWAWAAATG